MSIHPVLAVIPARGGSKGLSGKNIRVLAGVPLIGHSIRCAKLTRGIDRLIVSTDSLEIAEVARREGADVPFMRPAELAGDTTAMWPVLRHALESIEKLDGRRYGSLLLLDPTSPGRIPNDIEKALALLDADAGCDGVIGVSEPDFNPYWHCVVERDGHMQDLIPGAATYARRQDVPRVFRINATLYLWRRDFVLRADNWRTGRLKMLEVPERRAIHIDDIEQFELASVLLERKMVRLPWLS